MRNGRRTVGNCYRGMEVTAEQAKAAAEAMIALWEGEYPTTVRVLAAVPDDRRDYRPDPKSRSAWELVVHIATGDVWFLDSIARGAFRFDPASALQLEASFRTVGDVVAFYEATLPGKLAAARDVPGDALSEVMDLGGVKRKSRLQWIGSSLNHCVHQRGQLSAYLRSMGAKVPDLYGPSADTEPAVAAD